VLGNGELAPVAVKQLKSAARSADRIYRHSSSAERLDVAQDGADRHLKLAGQLPRGHPATGLQQPKQPDQPASTHSQKDSRHT
jgi:hypothetical protein